MVLTDISRGAPEGTSGRKPEGSGGFIRIAVTRRTPQGSLEAVEDLMVFRRTSFFSSFIFDEIRQEGFKNLSA
jgi:hypothetical protein